LELIAALMKPLKEAMGPMLAQLARTVGSAAPLTPVWASVVGELVARHTRPLKLEQGVLTVACDARAWREALEGERAATLTRLQAQLGEFQVRALVFQSP
jgi:predicted nucleic acid-binding Zn ribbon protein